MRVLFCGGRNYGDLVSLKGDRQHPDWDRREVEYRHVLDTLTRLSMDWPSTPSDDYGNNLPVVTIITGGARGVDSVAADWATVYWCRCHSFDADWNAHGRAAGPIRNAKMLAEGKPDLVVAFPGGVGTADMVRRAKKAGVEVIEIPATVEPSQ